MTRQLTREQIKLRQGHYGVLKAALNALETAAYSGLNQVEDSELEMWMIGLRLRLTVLGELVSEGSIPLTADERKLVEHMLAAKQNADKELKEES